MKIRCLWLLCLTTAVLVACQTATPAETATAVPSPAPSATSESALGYTAVLQTAPPTNPYPGPIDAIPTYSYQIINQYPHDPAAFTQGLLWHDGYLYEATGLYGESSLRRVSLEEGQVVQRVPLADEFFGEGLVLWQEQLIQITWREQTAVRFDLETFAEVGRFSYSGEGWGITHDGRRLIMSDGSHTLTFRNPETFAELGQLPVLAGNTAVVRLNELEYIDGEIWANIWQTDRIARIDPATGQVTAWVDLTGLRPADSQTDPDAVLNGIAYDAANGRLFVTGKRWPTLYEIQLVPQ